MARQLDLSPNLLRLRGEWRAWGIWHSLVWACVACSRQGAARQRAILAQALKLLAPGSRLVYATCSLEPEENEEVVRAAAGGDFAVSDVRQ